MNAIHKKNYVSVAKLTKRFGQNTVFENIDFNISQGEFITLLGPSGCGKSTLLRSLAGLNPVDGGRIYVDGEDITEQTPQERGIGMVFQSYALFPNMTVAGNIAFGLKMKSLRLKPSRKTSQMSSNSLICRAKKTITRISYRVVSVSVLHWRGL